MRSTPCRMSEQLAGLAVLRSVATLAWLKLVARGQEDAAVFLLERIRIRWTRERFHPTL